VGDRQVKLKLEVGDYKFECRGLTDKMVELAIQHLNSYKKTVNESISYLGRKFVEAGFACAH
jgi:hypothetical protein